MVFEPKSWFYIRMKPGILEPLQVRTKKFQKVVSFGASRGFLHRSALKCVRIKNRRKVPKMAAYWNYITSGGNRFGWELLSNPTRFLVCSPGISCTDP